MLFPAERKNALLYEGRMSVTDVIRFIADHGSDSHNLIHDNGKYFICWVFRKKVYLLELDNLYMHLTWISLYEIWFGGCSC